MDVIARALLKKLLSAGEKVEAGLRSRQAALTKSQLLGYRKVTSLQKKESFESTMKAAQVEGAVDLRWDNERTKEGFIERVSLRDARQLAGFLGVTLAQDKVTNARDQLMTLGDKFPILHDVFQRWTVLRKARGLGPDSVKSWLDAVRTIDYCRQEPASGAISLPIREASAKLFNDSKRIEKLAVPVDILLSDSIDGEVRDSAAVWQELGLFREEHPARLAGNVIVERECVTAYLDKPYIGLPTGTVNRLASVPELIMTIENQTTFHSEARRRCNEQVLLIYTAGMPSPSWRAMYVRLLQNLMSAVPVYHWGDVDEGGFRIASVLAREALTAGHILLPWFMHPDDVQDLPLSKKD